MSPAPRLVDQLWRSPRWAPVRRGDLLYVRSDEDEVLVLAAGALAGAGDQRDDAVAAPPAAVGRLAVRKPMVALLAAGARPVAVSVGVGLARRPDAEPVLAGVVAEAEVAGLDAASVVAHTEEDLPVAATALGVTVVGTARMGDLHVGAARPGDRVVLVGRPSGAADALVDPDDPEVLTIASLRGLLALPRVHEVLPVGADGIGAALAVIGERSTVVEAADQPHPLDRSGGPSTAALVAGDADLDALASAAGLPVVVVAELTPLTPS